MKHTCCYIAGTIFLTCLEQCVDDILTRALPEAGQQRAVAKPTSDVNIKLNIPSFKNPPKRQGDKMNTCIEAKCAGLPQPLYAQCIFEKCLSGINAVGAKKRTEKY